MYEELLLQQCMYAKAIRILAKRCLPISPKTTLRLQEIIKEVRTAIQKTNPDSEIIINRLHL